VIDSEWYCPFSSGTMRTSGAIGKCLTRRDTRPRIGGGSGTWFASQPVNSPSIFEIMSRGWGSFPTSMSWKVSSA
jgi:hypothetical protein